MCRIDPVKCPLDAWTRGWRTRRTVPSTTRTMYVIICTRVGLQAPGARCPTTPCPRRFGDGSLFIRHDQFFLTTHLFIRFSDSSSVFLSILITPACDRQVASYWAMYRRAALRHARDAPAVAVVPRARGKDLPALQLRHERDRQYGLPRGIDRCLYWNFI